MFNLTVNNIWDQEQNKPTLIVRDLKQIYPEIDEYVVYEVLLKRGVFKWLNVRRELIKLKNTWKTMITELNRKKTEQEKGFLKALELCRKQIRSLCHSQRWACPDFDRKANDFLSNYKG